jgi:hypothetical protein
MVVARRGVPPRAAPLPSPPHPSPPLPSPPLPSPLPCLEWERDFGACQTAGERACVASGTPAADEQWTLVRRLGASTANGICIHVGAFTLQLGTEGNGTPERAACRTAGERASVAPGESAADDRWTLGGWLEASTATGNCIHDGDSTSDAHERRVKDANCGHKR